MTHATPDEWHFEDWQLIAIALLTYRYQAECTAYERERVDAMIGAIASYWDLEEADLFEITSRSLLGG
ncbi:hypothetical protein [Halalkalicoccus subterraneus]|uniref:hypothetical protein n=1 Tax=Halalkalicoccus subterraneus TaxID=2675002 RepID=UPI000EFB8FDB|nr:hypothetical protein [Halalkalicoccus subterraneus]